MFITGNINPRFFGYFNQFLINLILNNSKWYSSELPIISTMTSNETLLPDSLLNGLLSFSIDTVIINNPPAATNGSLGGNSYSFIRITRLSLYLGCKNTTNPWDRKKNPEIFSINWVIIKKYDYICSVKLIKRKIQWPQFHPPK